MTFLIPDSEMLSELAEIVETRLPKLLHALSTSHARISATSQ